MGLATVAVWRHWDLNSKLQFSRLLIYWPHLQLILDALSRKKQKLKKDLL